MYLRYVALGVALAARPADGSGRIGMKTVAIVQSSYVPWKGTFEIIHDVDEFILFDDVQYTRRDWRNRNRIKTRDGLKWLTIPVEVSGNYKEVIHEIRVADDGWRKSHWNSLQHAYSKSPFFDKYRDRLEALYRDTHENSLSRINHRFLREMMDILGLDTKLSWSMDYAPVSGRKSERLIALCKAANATRYVSGPSARSYIDPQAFERAGIELTYMDFDGYPEYEQLYPPFCHEVSILDLIFIRGPAAGESIWGWR